jgi:hypothetical protein
MTEEGKKGFDTIALHGGYSPDTEATFGIGKSTTRGKRSAINQP